MTDQNMVERVARAICLADVFEVNADQEPVDDSWRIYAGLARAAIEAMREPTNAMQEAGAYGCDNGTAIAQQCWKDMIDAALSESQP